MCGRRQHKAFTMVELLVAIAVLVILASIAVIGLGRFGTPAKGKATLLTMENLRGMQADYEAQTRQQAACDLDTTLTPPALRAPGDVIMQTTDPLGRYGQATINTQRVLRQFMKVPSNKQAYSRLPANQQMQVAWASGVNYKVGDQVVHPFDSKNRYRCTGAHTSSGTGPTGNWAAMGVNDEFQTVPLDGWGNPIIYVPKDGLAVSSAAKYVRPPSGPERPFWASAGEDGTFSGGEDNVYSFEN